jgi:ribosomal protein S18 acetylase RimI-like enzyme
MTIRSRRSGRDDVLRMCAFWREHWGDDFMVVHGVIHRPRQLEGFVAADDSEWVGLITYSIMDGECEIISLDSLCERQGIGSRLIEDVVEEARRAGCKRVFLITTNDNLEAPGFYQKRGFTLVTVHRGAVNESRKIKASIPLIGMHGIPMRDELELEIVLH